MVGCGGTWCLLGPGKQSVVHSAAPEICAVSTRLSTKVPGWSGAIAIFPLRPKWDMLKTKGVRARTRLSGARHPQDGLSGLSHWHPCPLSSLSMGSVCCGLKGVGWRFQ